MAVNKLHFAVIDVGSNVLTMKIAERKSANEIRVLETVRGAMALGEDTYESGSISADATRRTCEILLGFKRKLDEYKIKPYRVVATSAIREAGNRDYILNRIYQTCGYRVEILDNSTESCWRLLAMAEGLRPYPVLLKKDVKVLDIGAGSVHITSFSKGKLMHSQTALIGALRVRGILDLLRQSSHDPFLAFSQYMDAELKQLREPTAFLKKPEALVVLGSEAVYLKRLAGNKRNEAKMSLQQFREVWDMLQHIAIRDLTLRYGIPPEACELMLPAAAIIDKYLAHSGAEELFLPEADLCLGILYANARELFGYKTILSFDEMVLAQADEIARRFESDMTHVHHVESNAVKIFDTLKKPYYLTDRQKLFLRLAALLTHVGAFIRLPRHASISNSIIRELELLGITQKERERLGYIAEFSVKQKLPIRSDMFELPGEYRQEIIALVSILRLAEALDASRQQKVLIKSAQLKKDKLQLLYASNETAYLETFMLDEYSRLFREIYGLQVQLSKEK